MSAAIKGPGTSILASEYWDCDCVTGYIHPRTDMLCGRCGAMREEQPDSRAAEVAAAGFEILKIEIPGQGLFRRRKK